MAFKPVRHYLKKTSQVGGRGLNLVKKTPGAHHLAHLARRYKIVFGLTAAIMVTLILTFFSVALYVVTGSAKLDLSRPGYEGVRKKISQSVPEQDSFESTGNLNSKVMTSYLNNYTKQTQALAGYDAFKPSLLDDSQLGLGDAQVAPTDGAN